MIFFSVVPDFSPGIDEAKNNPDFSPISSISEDRLSLCEERKDIGLKSGEIYLNFISLPRVETRGNRRGCKS
jgi:hypothetical protein